MTDYRKFYNVEESFFEEIQDDFKNKMKLTAGQFFMIVIWKSNRPKSRIAKSLLEQYKTDSLKKAVEQFTSQIPIFKGVELLEHLTKIDGIGLAMASAILSVLYPDEYTIYDYRVCDILGKHRFLSEKESIKMWEGYLEYIQSVTDFEEYKPMGLSLRDKDRYLWGKSFHEQLKKDIENNFNTKK